ncbi:MAG: hypothetical protein ACI4M5_03935 [Christensenellales bacterium]
MDKTKEQKLRQVKKPLTIFGVEVVYLCVLGIATAFLGWLAENVVKLISSGTFDCRFHLLPFISPYALIVFAVHIVFGNPDQIAPFGKRIFHHDNPYSKILSNLLVLVTIYVFVFFGELIVGNLWEILFSVKLWNYSSSPLHFTQYAGLIPTLGYGTGAYLLFRFVYTPSLKLLQRNMKHKTALILSCTLGVMIVVDTLIMILVTAITRQAPMYWSVQF